MIYLYISSKKPDNLGKTVVKIMFKFTNARAQGFSPSPRNVYSMTHYLSSDSYGCFFYFFSIKYNICKDFRETEVVSLYKLHA